MRKKLDKILMDYIRKFEEKHEVVFYFAVNDDLMNILCFDPYYFNISDVIQDIDNDYPKGLIFDWHEDSVEFHPKQINLESYVKGLRFEDNKNKENETN